MQNEINKISNDDFLTLLEKSLFDKKINNLTL